ncbi:hypothetical protein BZG36_05711, partial [Bifiguratus adelaidae]
YLYSPDGTPENSYHGGQALWNKVKLAQQFRRPKIALFSTYGYGAAHGKQSDAVISPIRVSETWALQELRYTREEYDQYVEMMFQGHLIRALVATDLPDLSDQVWDLTLGHPGLVTFIFNRIYRHFGKFSRTSITGNHFITFTSIYDYLTGSIFHSTVQDHARANQSLDRLSEAEIELCDEVVRNPRQVQIANRSEVMKRLSRVFILTENADFTLDFSAPLLRNVYLQLRFGYTIPATHWPETFHAFLKNVFQAMSSQVLQQTKGRGKHGYLLESTLQMEFYRAAKQLLPPNDIISPNVGKVFGGSGLYRLLDWRKQEMGYKKIVDHSNEWAVVDIRRYGLPIPDGLPGDNVVFVECEEDLAAVNITLPGSRYPERIKFF